MMIRKPIILIILLSLSMSLNFISAPVQQDDPAVRILESMSVDEKIGQLFMVTLSGTNFSADDPIFTLITDHHISGVFLTSTKDNFEPGQDALTKVQELIRELQALNFSPSAFISEGGLSRTTPEADGYLPLFIGYEYEGGQQGTISQPDALSPMASNMAIGATWNEELAYLTGELVGRELSALGINMILGPSLDLLENPQMNASSDLGIRAFGGDPYWVTLMGEAFITGLHAGSDRSIAVVATHFPGLGGSDRPIEEEVATVRKSLEELRQYDLAPFFAVTEAVEGDDRALVQGLLISHIRYQGLQGNIRATTRPISLDPQAFELVMSLEPLAQWRESGGLTVSDSLGSRAIRLFRDPTGNTFSAHLVARDAFLAGNDILLLSNFRDSADPDELTTILRTLDFFTNKYGEDPLFAQRVDEAVLRIIRQKIDQFGMPFTLANISMDPNDLSAIGSNEQLANRIAQSAATLISPDQAEIEDRVEGIPRIGERIVFLTDVRYVQTCSTCSAEPLMTKDALERAVLRLFGPGAAGQVGGWNLRSYSFADLANYLGVRPAESFTIPFAAVEEVDEAVRNADWLVFNLMDSRAAIYGASALQFFLDQRPDLAREKKLVVFAYDVPYGLDATEISKIDVLYALYDSGQAAIDMAAKLLFLEQTAPGASPVSIPGLGYELIEVTAPDGNQVIQIELAEEVVLEGATQEPPGYMIGDDVTIQTGVILDTNGNPVPDRTPVEFQIVTTAETTSSATVEAATTRGRAMVTFTIERAGLLAISARAGNATVSETLQLDVQEDVAAQAVVISPTLIPTVTSQPTLTPFVPTSTPSSQEDVGAIEGSFSSRLGALVLGLFAIGITSALGNFTAQRIQQFDETKIRFTLLPAIAGLLTYNYLALGLPGSATITTVLGGLGVFAFVGLGGLAGVFIAYLWDRLVTPETS